MIGVEGQYQTISASEAIHMAVQLQNGGRFKEAESILGQLLENDPGNYDALGLLGFLALQTGRNETAVNILKAAVSAVQNSPYHQVPENWYAWLGIGLAKINRFDEAVACYRQKSIDPFPPNVFFDQLLSIFIHSGRYHAVNRVRIEHYRKFHEAPQIRSLDQLGTSFVSDVYTSNIGLMSYLDIYTKMGQLGLHSHQTPILLLNDRCPNKPYLNYWRKYFPAVIADPHVKSGLLPLSARTEVAHYVRIPGGDTLHFTTDAATMVQRCWNEQKRPPLLALTDYDNDRGRQCLKKMGIPSDNWFVALHVREENEGGPNTRNATISTYQKAMQTIVNRGGWVIRMGGPSMSYIKPMDHVVDYVHTPFKSDWMDVFLWAKCRFFISTISGPANIPITFGVPSIATNVMPLQARPWYSDLFIPKLIWSDKENRYLTFTEILRSPAGYAFFDRDVVSYGCRVIDNSPEDINDLVLEMFNRLEGRQQYTKVDDEIQSRIDNLEVSIEYDHQKIQGLARIGQAFGEKYAHLI